MDSARAFIATTILAAASTLGGVGAFNAWVDPFMQYRMPIFPPRFVTGFARHINAGLARNLEYDSVIVGSSYAMNFRNSDFDREFGGRTISLAMPGMFVSEGRRVVDYASSLKPLKRVYFGVDFYAFEDSANRYEFPDYLYDARWTRHAPYLLSLETLKRSIYIVLGQGPENYNTDPDMPWTWVRKGARFGRERALADYARHGSPQARDANVDPLPEMEQVAREQLARLVAEHPNIQFEFFLPPYSVLSWMLEAKKGNLALLLQFRLFLAQLVAQYPNARLHDFQALRALVCDLDRYADVGHYDPEASRMLVAAMRSGGYVAGPESAGANNSAIKEIVRGRCSGTVPGR